MADKRAFAVFDVGYLDNPKIIEILDESTEAVMMHAYSVLYSSQHLTDGHIPVKRMVKHIGGSQADVDLLTGAGLWHLPGHECDQCQQPTEGRVYVHNYLEHNRDKASTTKLSEEGRMHAARRWNDKKGADGLPTGIPKGKPTGKPNGYPKGDPNGVPNAQTDRQTDKEIQQQFDTWWPHYPKKVDKGQALKAFKSALKKTSVEELSKAASNYAQECKREKIERKFIKNPATWLNAEAWENEPDPTTPSTTTSLWEPGNNDRYLHPDER